MRGKYKTDILLLKQNCISSLLIILIFAVFQGNSSAGENNTADHEKNYIFNYDQDIPTLIKYGSKISGLVNKSAYMGFVVWGDNNSTGTLDIGYNLTRYELQSPDYSLGRILTIGGAGYIPFLWEKSAISDSTHGLTMLSPLFGFSYLQKIATKWGIGLSINAGPVYAQELTTYKNEDEADLDWVDYESYLEACETMHDVPGHWGGRINPKCRFYFMPGKNNYVNIGLNLGYTQYIFKDNDFNSYDIGLAFSILL